MSFVFNWVPCKRRTPQPTYNEVMAIRSWVLRTFPQAKHPKVRHIFVMQRYREPLNVFVKMVIGRKMEESIFEGELPDELCEWYYRRPEIVPNPAAEPQNAPNPAAADPVPGAAGEEQHPEPMEEDPEPMAAEEDEQEPWSDEDEEAEEAEEDEEAEEAEEDEEDEEAEEDEEVEEAEEAEEAPRRSSSKSDDDLENAEEPEEMDQAQPIAQAPTTAAHVPPQPVPNPAHYVVSDSDSDDEIEVIDLTLDDSD